MTKEQKLFFIILQPAAFISTFLVYAFNSALGLICFLPLLILLVWSISIIRERTALAVSGLIVSLLTILIFLAVALPSYWAYQERHKQQSINQPKLNGTGPRVECQVAVPTEYQKTPWNPPPNGEPEPIRYKKSYEAFWWNCIMVKANKLDARCPFTCSGTPATVAGCVDGESDADRQITALLNKYSPSEVQQYLRSVSSTEEAKKKIYPYFQETPQPEKVK